MKWEFNFVDNLNKASALSTDQIDVENGARYGIFFVDEDGTKKNPIILHNSPSGAVERVIYALLEKAARVQKTGGTPILPVWLSPTQVRVLPVSQEYLQLCEKIVEQLESNKIRVDLDDREETLGKRIREAETEWVPYILVVGEKEAKGEKLSVRDRAAGKVKEVTVQELTQEISAENEDKPFMQLNMPKYMSKRSQIMV
jgi:threonyl-tRNA synthetase